MKLRRKQQLFPVLDSFNTAHLTEVLPRYLTMLTWYGTWYNGTWYQVPTGSRYMVPGSDL